MSGDKRRNEGFEQFEMLLSTWSRRDFLRRSGGAIAFAALGVGGIELLEACENPAEHARPAPVSSPVKGGHIVEGSPNEISHFISVLRSDVYSGMISGLCFEGLLSSKANGDLMPAIAKEVPAVTPDGLTYTCNLRQDVSWSDGRPLTAEDVVFTYRLFYDPVYREVNSPFRAEIETQLESITARDRYTVVLKTKRPYAPLLSLLGPIGILPRHVLGDLSPKAINTTPFDGAPNVVSGVFKFVRWDKGQQVVLARNETYFRGPSYLDQYVYKVPSTLAAGNQLTTGEVDVSQFDYSQVDAIRATSNVHTVIFNDASFLFYGYQVDPSKPAARLFGDKRVRQALLYALDRQKMVDAAYFRQAQVGTGFESPTSWAYNPHVTPSYPYDKKRAEQLLDAAGWTRNASTGIREKGGLPLKFEMISAAGRQPLQTMLLIMQESWRDVGVDASTKLTAFPQLVTQLSNVRTFDLFLTGRAGSQDPDQALYWNSASAAPGGFNAMPYRNPEVDRLFEEAVSTLDRGKRKRIYYKIQDMFAEDCVAAVLAYPKQLWGVNKRVQNFNLGPFNQYFSRPWMKDVFVSDGK